MRLDATGRRVLIIPDLHIPYEHPDSYKFLKEIKRKFLLPGDIIMNLGDEVDNHAISFHDSISELLSAGDELKVSIERIQGIKKLFPKMYLCDSNHGSLLFRRMKSHGVPVSVIKPLQEIYDTPKWEWHEDYVVKTHLGDIYICHGKSSTYGKLCRETGLSSIQGHFHSKYEITWHETVSGTRFNMFVGCLADRSSLAFSYAKNNIPKFILGTAIIDERGHPFLVKMNLDDKGRWDGHLNGN